MSSSSDKSDSVSVAVRVRPLLPKDVAEGARECLRKLAGTPQLVLGADRSFTFDHVFEADEPNGNIFDSCARELVQGTLEGYNSTIFAYGQTGSGKTHTMGSSFQEGVAPVVACDSDKHDCFAWQNIAAAMHHGCCARCKPVGAGLCDPAKRHFRHARMPFQYETVKWLPRLGFRTHDALKGDDSPCALS